MRIPALFKMPKKVSKYRISEYKKDFYLILLFRLFNDLDNYVITQHMHGNSNKVNKNHHSCLYYKGIQRNNTMFRAKQRLCSIMWSGVIMEWETKPIWFYYSLTVRAQEVKFLVLIKFMVCWEMESTPGNNIMSDQKAIL